MRFSRPRLVLRLVLLVTGGAFMLWHARDARRALGTLQGTEALLATRVALVWALAGLLALATAAGAALSLRSRPPRRTLRLEDLPPDPASREPRESSTREGRSPPGY